MAVSAVKLFLGVVLQENGHRSSHGASSCFHGEVERDAALFVLHKDVRTTGSQVSHVICIEYRCRMMQQCSPAPNAIDIDEGVDVPAKMLETQQDLVHGVCVVLDVGLIQQHHRI